MGSSYLSRLSRFALPYVIFYFLLAGIGKWQPIGWLLSLPILLISLFKVFPRSRFELREIRSEKDKVRIRYSEFNAEKTKIIPMSTLHARLVGDPATIYRRYVLELKGPDFKVRQYEQGYWTEQRMKEVYAALKSQHPITVPSTGASL